MQKRDDAALIVDIQQGDIGAFRELVERYKKRIYYLAYDLSGNLHDAEDLSQEVFIKVYQAIHRYRPEASPYSWLYRITINTYIDQKRKRILDIIKPRSTYKADILPEPREDSADGNAEKKTESALLQNHLQNALDTLSKREKTVFWISQTKTKADEETIELLKSFVLDAEHPAIQEKALFGLMNLPDGKGVPALIEIAKTHPALNIRKKAVFWLGQSEDERALKAVEDILYQSQKNE